MGEVIVLAWDVNELSYRSHLGGKKGRWQKSELMHRVIEKKAGRLKMFLKRRRHKKRREREIRNFEETTMHAR